MKKERYDEKMQLIQTWRLKKFRSHDITGKHLEFIKNNRIYTDEEN